ncbi:MAG TPA: metallophosphoesterase [Myxococcota bacterium]|nr:metallophosphoesterase [Myxococcota bacterium]
MNRRSLVLFSLGALAAVGCVATVAAKLPPAGFVLPPLAGEAPWTGAAPLRDEGDFDFIVVTDRTGEHRDDVFERAMPPKVNSLRPEFVMSVGDLIEGYTEDRRQLAKEWDEIETAAGELAMPFFYVPGNHDMSNAVMAEVWKERFGPSFYHFVYQDVLFLALNSELFQLVHDPKTQLPGPWTQAEQLAYAEKVLRENAGVRWTFVFIHQPLWDVPKQPLPGQVTAPAVNPDWLRVEQWLGDRPYTVFAGHYHRYTEHVRNDRQFITLATTGGGSELRGTPYGEFDQVARVSMTKDGPLIANLRMDGILPADVVTEQQRALVLALPRAIVQEPLTGDADAFRSGTARFSIANTGKQPLRAVGRAHGSPQLDAGDVTLRAEVEPGGVANLELPIRARAPVSYQAVLPAHVEWTLATTGPNGAPLSIETESIVVPEQTFSLRAAAAPVANDADLADWAPLAFDVRAPGELAGHGDYEGAADASFAWDVRHSDDLHLAVQVRDDDVVSTPARTLREQDHVVINVDARSEADRNKNMDYLAARLSGELRKQITTFCGPQPAPAADPILAMFAPSAGHTKIACAARQTSNGYALEVTIPAARLDEIRGARWDALRINVAVVDFDGDAVNHNVISWRPSRFGPNAVAGSGTFVRQ